RIKPDIILLSGGTDGGNAEVILKNAETLSKIPLSFPVVIAGNKKMSKKCAEVLNNSGKKVTVTENVMPEFNVLNILPAQNAIRDVFLERIIRAKGITHIESLIEGIIMPTPSAVLRAASLLSRGTKTEKGIGDLLLVDMGGATTDVYSICSGKPHMDGVIMKGLPEPFEKRTVEGDLGARYTAENVVDAYTIDEFSQKSGLSIEKIKNLIEKVKHNYSIISTDGDEAIFDKNIAGCSVEMAVMRHAGTIESNYTTNGLVFVQSGKDLTDVKHIIGTGGPIINASCPKDLLKFAEFSEENSESLRPKKPNYYIDKKYIYAAMGLLSSEFPDVALRILKKETIEI
ncbi:MAG: glutamate mutase L, partial [Clostridia bacterium]